jgi:hypothetical protein
VGVDISAPMLEVALRRSRPSPSLAVTFRQLDAQWHNGSFGRIEGDTLIRLVCTASTMLSLGFQLVLSAFFMLLLDQRSGEYG